MPFKIVRNDITKMNTEAIVNTANEFPSVGTGCDSAIYKAAGYDELLKYRQEKIGYVAQGEVFITPGFNLFAKYIIHAVSPLYDGGNADEEVKLRSCYKKSLELAKENGIKSIAFPLIATGGYGYPKEEGMRIAVDEINAFLLENDMLIYLVVFDDKTVSLGDKIYPDLEEYIDQNYVEEKRVEEYGEGFFKAARREEAGSRRRRKIGSIFGKPGRDFASSESMFLPNMAAPSGKYDESLDEADEDAEVLLSGASLETIKPDGAYFDIEEHESKLEERMKHLSDTFSQYLLYLIQDKKMENSEVYKRAIVDKKTFSKIKNNVNYHPQKITALCLCVGAMLNLDESKDLLARAGYALSPCDKTDIIFSYFIENEIYDMIELDIQLEEHGLPCIIS